MKKIGFCVLCLTLFFSQGNCANNDSSGKTVTCRDILRMVCLGVATCFGAKRKPVWALKRDHTSSRTDPKPH